MTATSHNTEDQPITYVTKDEEHPMHEVNPDDDTPTVSEE